MASEAMRGGPGADSFARAAARRLAALALVALAALALAAPALAQTTTVCSDTPTAGQRIVCTEDAASTDDIEISTSGLAIETTADQEHGIVGQHSGAGTVEIESRADTIATEGQIAHGILASHKGSAGDIVLRAVSTNIETKRTGAGALSRGIWAETTAAGKVDVEIVGGRIATAGDGSLGIDLDHFHAGSGTAGAIVLDIGGGAEIETSGARALAIHAERSSHGDIALTLRDTAIDTAGTGSVGIGANQLIDPKPGIVGDITVDLLGGVRIATAGEGAEGIFANATGNDRAVRSDVTVRARGDNAIATEGDDAEGIIAQRVGGGAGNILVDLRGTSITTGGSGAHGIFSIHDGPGDIDIRLSGGGVTTQGVGASGILASRNAGGPGDVRIVTRNHRIVTESTEVDTNSQRTDAHGIDVEHGSTGDIVIDLRGGSIETRGVQSHGIHAYNLSTEDGGNIRVRTGAGHSIVTAGVGAYGIWALNGGTGADIGAILVDVEGSVRADGENAHGIAVGGLTAGVVTDASPFDADGYRRQTVRVNGRVYGGTGTGAGVVFAGGGRLFIGPRGLVGALSGVAVRAAGDNVVDGETLPRRLLVHLLPEGGSPAALLDGRFVNEGGETVLAVNGTPLYDTVKGGRTGLWAPNGARDVTLVEHFTGLDFSSAESFIDRYAPRAAAYEALPGVLMRMDGEGPAGTGALRRPGSPLWLRLSGGEGAHEPQLASTGGRYSLDRNAAEIGLDYRLGEELSASLGAHRVSGEARIAMPAGRARVEAEGYGLSGRLAWQGDEGAYGTGRLSLTRFTADLSSAARGRLVTGASGLVQSLDLEGGQRFELEGGRWLTARAWLGSAGVSVDDFTDAVGSRVSVEKAERATLGLGAAAGTTVWSQGEAESLVLTGGLGMERTLSEESAVVVTGERLTSEGAEPRLLFDLGGTWRSAGLTLDAALRVHGLLSSDENAGTSLHLRMAF